MAKKYKFWSSFDVVLGEVTFAKALEGTTPITGSWFGPFENFTEARISTVEIMTGMFATTVEKITKTRLHDAKTIKARKKNESI